MKHYGIGEVLPTKDGTGYLERLVFALGVSGVSVTAAYIGLNVFETVTDFRERFYLSAYPIRGTCWELKG